MTPAQSKKQQQPKEHCEHECVCYLFIQNCFTGDSPCLETCEHDTRSRPHPAPAHNTSCEGCDIGVPYCIFDCPIKKENDAAIARKAREDRYKELREKISQTTDEDCVGEMNSDECLRYEANCNLCKFDHAVESLRQNQGEQEHPR